MKYTVEILQKMGYKGYQRNTMTGHTLEARYVLEDIAWRANNRPEQLQFTKDDIGGMIRVHYSAGGGASPTNLANYAERPMTAEELIEADERLAELGMTVERKKTSRPKT